MEKTVPSNNPAASVPPATPAANTPPPTATPSSAPAATNPAPSTFSTPPEKSGSKFKLLVSILIILIIITLGLGAYYFFFMNKSNDMYKTSMISPVPTLAPASPTPTVIDTSNEGLTSDSTEIENNTSLLENQMESINSGLTEPTPNLQ